MKTMTRFDRAVEYAADEIAKWKYSRYIKKDLSVWQLRKE